VFVHLVDSCLVVCVVVCGRLWRFVVFFIFFFYIVVVFFSGWERLFLLVRLLILFAERCFF